MIGFQSRHDSRTTLLHFRGTAGSGRRQLFSSSPSFIRSLSKCIKLNCSSKFRNGCLDLLATIFFQILTTAEGEQSASVEWLKLSGRSHRVARWTLTYDTPVPLLASAPDWSWWSPTGRSPAARSQCSLPALPLRYPTAPGSTSSLHKPSWPLMTAQSSCGKCPGEIHSAFILLRYIEKAATSLKRYQHAAMAHLSAIVVEDAHEADGNHLVDAAAQSLPGERKHKGHLLFPTRVDDGVERFIQSPCRQGAAIQTSR